MLIPELQHRTINWELMGVLDQHERMEEMLGPKWMAILKCDRPQYRELTVEFYSTFRYNADRFLEQHAVSFSLGRRLYEFSVPRFAVVAGIYTDKEVKASGFSRLLRGSYKKKRSSSILTRDLKEFWRTIAVGEFGNNVTESRIRDPVIRFIHRILACTLVA